MQEEVLLVARMLDQTSRQLAGIAQSFQQTAGAGTSSAEEVASRWTRLRDTLSGVSQKVSLGLTGLAAAFGKLAGDAGRASSIADSFRGMMERMGVSADELIRNMRQASAGLVSEMELMQKSTQAFMLIGRDAFDTVGGASQAMTKLLEIAMASARATGQDVNFMFDSIVTGIGRASPMILDNLGLTVSIADATNRYAEEMGIAANEMTKEQKSAALLNEVLRKGQGFVEDFGVSAGGLRSQTQELQASFEDLRIELGATFIPVAQKGMDILMGFLPVVEMLIPVFDKLFTLIAKLPDPVFAAGAAFVSLQVGARAAGGPLGELLSLIPGLGKALTGLAGAGGPILLVVAAVAGLAVAWQEDWMGIRTFTESTVDSLIERLGGLRHALGELVGAEESAAESMERLLMPHQAMTEQAIRMREAQENQKDAIAATNVEMQRHANIVAQTAQEVQVSLEAQAAAAASFDKAMTQSVPAAKSFADVFPEIAQRAQALGVEIKGLEPTFENLQKVQTESAQAARDISTQAWEDLAAGVQGAVSEMFDVQSEYDSNIRQLHAEMQAQITAAQEAGNSERVAELQASLAQQEQELSLSYEQQMMIQEQALAEMVLNQVTQWRLAGDITAEQAAEMTAAIQREYGAQVDETALATAEILQNLKLWQEGHLETADVIGFSHEQIIAAGKIAAEAEIAQLNVRITAYETFRSVYEQITSELLGMSADLARGWAAMGARYAAMAAAMGAESANVQSAASDLDAISAELDGLSAAIGGVSQSITGSDTSSAMTEAQRQAQAAARVQEQIAQAEQAIAESWLSMLETLRNIAGEGVPDISTEVFDLLEDMARELLSRTTNLVPLLTDEEGALREDLVPAIDATANALNAASGSISSIVDALDVLSGDFEQVLERFFAVGGEGQPTPVPPVERVRERLRQVIEFGRVIAEEFTVVADFFRTAEGEIAEEELEGLEAAARGFQAAFGSLSDIVGGLTALVQDFPTVLEGLFVAATEGQVPDPPVERIREWAHQLTTFANAVAEEVRDTAIVVEARETDVFGMAADLLGSAAGIASGLRDLLEIPKLFEGNTAVFEGTASAKAFIREWGVVLVELANTAAEVLRDNVAEFEQVESEALSAAGDLLGSASSIADGLRDLYDFPSLFVGEESIFLNAEEAQEFIRAYGPLLVDIANTAAEVFNENVAPEFEQAESEVLSAAGDLLGSAGGIIEGIRTLVGDLPALFADFGFADVEAAKAEIRKWGPRLVAMAEVAAEELQRADIDVSEEAQKAMAAADQLGSTIDSLVGGITSLFDLGGLGDTMVQVAPGGFHNVGVWRVVSTFEENLQRGLDRLREAIPRIADALSGMGVDATDIDFSWLVDPVSEITSMLEDIATRWPALIDQALGGLDALYGFAVAGPPLAPAPAGMLPPPSYAEQRAYGIGQDGRGRGGDVNITVENLFGTDREAAEQFAKWIMEELRQQGVDLVV